MVTLLFPQYNYILHDSLNAMLGKTSVSMMVLLVAASLIGISSIHQYVEGQKPPAKTPLAGSTSRVVGEIVQVTSYAPVAGCITSVILAKTYQVLPEFNPVTV